MDPSVHALVHLSGPHRGSTQILDGPEVRAGTGSDAELHFPTDREPAVASRHARLRRTEEGWRVEPRSDASVFVNGRATAGTTLEDGDVVELGRGGPLLRYRHGDVPADGYKSVRQALEDCVDCARYGARSWWGRGWTFARSMPRELLTQTRPWARAVVLGGLALLAASVGYLFAESRELDRRLRADRSRLAAVAESVRAERRERRLSPAVLDSLRRAWAPAAGARGGGEGASDGRALVSRASRAVVFIQGSFGFVDPDTGEPVRARPSGGPRAQGSVAPPRVGPDVDGPPLRRRFTGTGFVVTRGGHVLTNRHLVRPWRQDRIAASMRELGYEPRLERLVGFLPGHGEPFELRLVASSDSADLTLLECSDVTGRVEPLRLAEEPPRPGEPVYVLGYPTGIRALLARSAPEFLRAVRRDSSFDFWSVAERLAAEGHIQPLATRGIVGQVTATSVVYDAETTEGGSGGPVLNESGEVVAVNRAIMREFGGSNLGVPAAYARRLLEGNR